MATSAPLVLEYCCSVMTMPAVRVADGDVEDVRLLATGGMLDAGVMVADGQLKNVVGGKVLQPHSGSVLVCMGYELDESPHTHQPGLLAMAAQVFWGSAAWEHNALLLDADVTGVED